jgi:hypothetical protein
MDGVTTLFPILPYLGNDALVGLLDLNKQLNSGIIPIITERFNHAFGRVPSNLDVTTGVSLLNTVGKQPITGEIGKVYKNVFSIPQSRIERWKWIAGIKNSLDQRVEKQYLQKISLLENTGPTSIIQLKNHQVAYWHCDRQILDYQEFKKGEQARATKGLLNRIFFACVKLFLRFPCGLSDVITPTKSLFFRSRDLYVNMGSFKLGDNSYHVLANHCSDTSLSLSQKKQIELRASELGLDYKSLKKTVLGFNSAQYGKTSISIYARNGESLVIPPIRQKHNFFIDIGRNAVSEATRSCSRIRIEESLGNEPLLNDRRWLSADFSTPYAGREPEGSNRKLDRKLTQVLIEMAMQNWGIIGVTLYPNCRDVPLLVAGGFDLGEEVNGRTNADIDRFRSNPTNNLFPPVAEEYKTRQTHILNEDYNEPNVRFKREGSESWAEIIKREPILIPNSGILPEFWAKAPNIFEGSLESID